MNGKELLRIEDLEIRYETDDGVAYALNGVSLHVKEGETLGLVGETGAGKTTLAKGILRLIQTPPGKIVNGKVYFDGKDILAMSDHDLHQVRGNAISMVFQDPIRSRRLLLFITAISARRKSGKERLPCSRGSGFPLTGSMSIRISSPEA